MVSNNTFTSVENVKLSSEFDRLRETLLRDEFADHLNRPLAFWALPNDRRLPLAFLGRTLRELLKTSFDELSATPGVGQKKTGTLIELLARATKKQPLRMPSQKSAADKKPMEQSPRTGASFDPSAVSEALWEEWRETVCRHDIGHETIGRLAPSLQSVPTVLWNTPLAEYCGYTLAEMRQLKTHGEKRVRTILEVFHAVHHALAHAPEHGPLTMRLFPRFVVQTDRRIAETVESGKIPTLGELREQFILPLVDQLRLDLGPAIAKLVEGRLGLTGNRQPVRRQSRRLGVTRARVYQLFEDCAKAMAVRWPEGGRQLRSLFAHLQKIATPSDRLDMLRATIDLVYPDAESLANRADEAATG